MLCFLIPIERGVRREEKDDLSVQFTGSGQNGIIICDYIAVYVQAFKGGNSVCRLFIIFKDDIFVTDISSLIKPRINYHSKGEFSTKNKGYCFKNNSLCC